MFYYVYTSSQNFYPVHYQFWIGVTMDPGGLLRVTMDPKAQEAGAHRLRFLQQYQKK